MNLNSLLLMDGLEEIFSIPLIWKLFWILLLIIIFSLAVRYAFRRSNISLDKAPTMFQTVMEMAVGGFDKLMDGITGGRLKKAYPYFFSLFVFLNFSVILTFLGFESPAISILFTFTLGSITFIGIYVVGITSKGIWGFIRHKYSNPLEIFQQFAPLLSISIRLFGATFGMTIVFSTVTIVLNSFGYDLIATLWPIIALPFSWATKSVDLFLSFIQAYVFTLLTAMYWSMELPNSEKESRKYKKQQRKEAKLAKQQHLEHLEK